MKHGAIEEHERLHDVAKWKRKLLKFIDDNKVEEINWVMPDVTDEMLIKELKSLIEGGGIKW